MVRGSIIGWACALSRRKLIPTTTAPPPPPPLPPPFRFIAADRAPSAACSSVLVRVVVIVLRPDRFGFFFLVLVGSLIGGDSIGCSNATTAGISSGERVRSFSIRNCGAICVSSAAMITRMV